MITNKALTTCIFAGMDTGALAESYCKSQVSGGHMWVSFLRELLAAMPPDLVAMGKVSKKGIPIPQDISAVVGNAARDLYVRTSMEFRAICTNWSCKFPLGITC